MSYDYTSSRMSSSLSALAAFRCSAQASSPWTTPVSTSTAATAIESPTKYPPPSRMRIATTDMTIPVINVATEREVSHRCHPVSGNSWFPQAACGGNFKHKTVPMPIKTVAKSAVTCAALGVMPEPYEALTPSLLRHAEMAHSDTTTDKES